jgi:hypothetical protein
LCESYPRTVVFEARGKFGNPEERKRLPLKAVTTGLVKTRMIEKTKCMR